MRKQFDSKYADRPGSENDDEDGRDGDTEAETASGSARAKAKVRNKYHAFFHC